MNNVAVSKHSSLREKVWYNPFTVLEHPLKYLLVFDTCAYPELLGDIKHGHYGPPLCDDFTVNKLAGKSPFHFPQKENGYDSLLFYMASHGFTFS